MATSCHCRRSVVWSILSNVHADSVSTAETFVGSNRLANATAMNINRLTSIYLYLSVCKDTTDYQNSKLFFRRLEKLLHHADFVASAVITDTTLFVDKGHQRILHIGTTLGGFEDELL